MKLEIPIKADVGSIVELIEELKALQTYKLSEDDEMVLVNRDDVVEVFANHVVTINDNTADVKVTNRNDNDTISRQAAIDTLKMDINIIPFAKAREYARAVIETIYNRLEGLPPAQPNTCEGCKHLGKWENEVEYGYPSPCTYCKRRVEDNYER